MKLPLLFICMLFTHLINAQNLNVKFRSQLKYGSQSCSNICGYVDSTGKEYALVGAEKGLSIVDVSNPDSPVQLIQIPGPSNEWREIKVRGTYAYVTTEGGGGLQIVNMRSLPNKAGIVYKNWTGDGAIAGKLTSIHALHIDKNFVYLYGSKLYGGGAVVVDVTDPWTPKYVGNYQNKQMPYVHDGYVRNDTLFACHIYDGYFTIVDFRKKSAPVLLGTKETPTKFTHNSWLSKDSKTVFTTDENTKSFLTAYDVTDPSSIVELDRIQSNPKGGSIVHNTHIINVRGNDYAVTSWYRDGFTIVDVGRPSNLVQVGNYDTYPSGAGNGFNGDWGVYPYLPSGTIVVSNIEDGLHVFTPTYTRACYLEGTVTDSITGLPINRAVVQIQSIPLTDSTKNSGEYGLGMPAPGGTYSVKYSKTGYYSKTITGVVLTSGNVVFQNVKLRSLSSGISEFENASINAYPNPFNNDITISYELYGKLSAATEISITDMLGRTIEQKEVTQLNGTVTLSPNVGPGVYFIRVHNSTESSNPIKVIKLDKE